MVMGGCMFFHAQGDADVDIAKAEVNSAQNVTPHSLGGYRPVNTSSTLH